MAPNELSIFGLNNVIYAGLNIVTVNNHEKNSCALKKFYHTWSIYIFWLDI